MSSRSRSRATCRCPYSSYSSDYIMDCFDVYVQRTLSLLSVVVTIILGMLIYIFKILYDRSLLVTPVPNVSGLNLPQLFKHETPVKKEQNRAKDKKISFITEKNTSSDVCPSPSAQSVEKYDDNDCESKAESFHTLDTQVSPSSVTMNERFLKNIGYPNQSKFKTTIMVLKKVWEYIIKLYSSWTFNYLFVAAIFVIVMLALPSPYMNKRNEVLKFNKVLDFMAKKVKTAEEAWLSVANHIFCLHLSAHDLGSEGAEAEELLKDLPFCTSLYDHESYDTYGSGNDKDKKPPAFNNKRFNPSGKETTIWSYIYTDSFNNNHLPAANRKNVKQKE